MTTASTNENRTNSLAAQFEASDYEALLWLQDWWHAITVRHDAARDEWQIIRTCPAPDRVIIGTGPTLQAAVTAARHEIP